MAKSLAKYLHMIYNDGMVSNFAGGEKIGMTDAQFKAHIRSLKNRLEKAMKNGDWEAVKELIDELQQALED